MDRREIIRNVLAGESSNRLPRAIFGGGLWSFRQTGLKIEEVGQDPEHFGRSLAGLFRGLDTDIIFAGSGLNTFPAEAIGGRLAFREQQAPLLAFPVIEKTEDARYLDSISISDSPHAMALVAMISSLRRHLPDRYICATSWGPFTWAMILCDWNLLQEKTVSDRTFIREVCDLGVRLSFAFLEPLIKQGLIDGISIPDGAATLVSDDLYRDIILPSERMLFEKVRELGAGCFLHQCGNILRQVSMYPDTGADCVSLDAGVDIGEVYSLYSRQLVTAGNVDVINAIFGGDPDRICSAVAECVSGIPRPFRRYILMPSCDLPPDTPLLNVKEFLACADRV